MELYSHLQAQKLAGRVKGWSIAAGIAAFLGLAGCIACCLLSARATAAQYELLAGIISTGAGWFVIFAITAQILPNRYDHAHESNMLAGPRETVTGPVAIEPEILQIPKSIAICKVVLGTGRSAQRLSIRADKLALLQPYDGKTITLQTVHGYIVAIEEQHETT